MEREESCAGLYINFIENVSQCWENLEIFISSFFEENKNVDINIDDYVYDYDDFVSV